MTDIELINKIKELKQIKPREEWVLLTRDKIFAASAEPAEHIVFLTRSPSKLRKIFSLAGSFFNTLNLRPAFIPIAITSLTVLFGVFGFARNTVPGDILYPVKRATEITQINFASGDQKIKIQLDLANKRLEELNSIAQTNQVNKLAPAIKEFQANISEAAKSLAALKEPAKNPQAVEGFVIQIKKIEKNIAKTEAVLETTLGTEDLNNVLAQIVEKEILSLENKILTEQQEQILQNIKKDYNAGNYTSALEKILLFNNQ